MLRRVFLSLALGLAASCACAQTAPSPADVGISKGTPDVFKLKGHDNAWTPFGSIDPSTHIFIPGTNGNIAPNDCIKWGPGLTSAGAACNSVTGGAHPANQFTIYTNHAGLLANVTTPTEAWTVVQQGFYAPGDGGSATYQWNLTSTCVADGINCVLPIGQSPSTAGRYLLQISGSLDVRQIGMQSGGADNSPLLATLMNTLGPNNNAGSAEVVFPGNIDQPFTPYYFSKSFINSRYARFRCGSGGGQVEHGVELVFAAGVQGFIQEDAHFSPDGRYGGGTVDGCALLSLGFGQGFAVPGASTITGVSMYGDQAGIIPVSTWGVGDGIIVTPYAAWFQGISTPIPAVHPGAYISGVSGSTLTLASGYTISAALNPSYTHLALYQLPAALKFTVQTTTGSSTAIVTAGPRPLVTGEMIWSDAFPIGSTVFTTDGNTFPQTITVSDYSVASGSQNATVTHGSGAPGQMWIVPAGLKRDTTANSNNNKFLFFPIGLNMACTSADYLNCDASYDNGNFYSFGLIGRRTAGNNTSASSSINEVGATNFWTDFVNGGTLGEVDVNFNSNSSESGSAAYTIIGNCINQNYSALLGGYVYGGGFSDGSFSGGCAAPGTLLPPTPGSPWLAVGLQTGSPAGTPTISTTGELFGQWSALYAGNCVGFGVNTWAALSVSTSGCATFGTMGLAWNAGINAWTWLTANADRHVSFYGENFKGYLPIDMNGGSLFEQGLELGNPSQDFMGEQRLLDGGTAPPTVSRLQGDIRLNQIPATGQSFAWANVKIGQVTLTANLAAGATSVAVSACPASPAIPAGAPVVAYANINSGGIVLDQVLGTLASCTGTTLTLNAGSAFASANGMTIQFLEWHAAGRISNDLYGVSQPAGAITDVASVNSLAPCDSRHIGTGMVNNGQTVAAAGYNAAMGSATGSTTRLIFCDGASWTYH